MDTQTSILLSSIRNTFSALDDPLLERQLYFIDKALSDLFVVKKQIEGHMFFGEVSYNDPS